MSRYRKYNGNDKYHFRYYHLSNNHPFLVVLVLEEKSENGKVLISGFNMTTSNNLYNQKPRKFIKLKTNPDPSNKKQSYVKTDLVSLKPSKFFSDPLVCWHLDDEDTKAIDEMIRTKYPKLKKDPKVLIRDQPHILFRRAKYSSYGCNHLLIVTMEDTINHPEQFPVYIAHIC